MVVLGQSLCCGFSEAQEGGHVEWEVQVTELSLGGVTSFLITWSGAVEQAAALVGLSTGGGSRCSLGTGDVPEDSVAFTCCDQ